MDGAIGNAGGSPLFKDRQNLPEVGEPGSGIRCPTGKAVVTGPNSYGTLEVPYVIHAVGPNYLDYDSNELSLGDDLLTSAYLSTLECGKDDKLEAVAFCLLSAGIFRGERSLKEVLQVGLESINAFEGYEGLKEVHVCGFTSKEMKALVSIAKEIGLKKAGASSSKERKKGSPEKKSSASSADTGTSADQSSKESGEQQRQEKEGKVGAVKPPQEEKKDKDAVEDTREEWEIRREELKSAGDSHFRSKSYSLAIQAYQDALQLDPTNHILLSNKSAAHLSNGEKSKALHDARKCVEHAPVSWAKGHTRLAAAMVSLGRFNEAATVYSKVLNELDPDNKVAKAGLEGCRSKQRKARDDKEREATRLQMELDRQKAEKEEKEKQVKVEDAGDEEEDDLLDDFFSEVEKVSEKPKPSKNEKDANGKSEGGDDSGNNRIKTQISDLGTSASQIDRLLQVNHEWKNLNPFYVLDIPHTIEDDSIISARYRALSLLVHPDKCPNDPARAKSAFEEVRKAMSQMNDEDKRRHVSALIEQGMKQGKRDWEAEKSSTGGVHGSKKDEEEGLVQMQNKATMKIFAEIEQKRRNIERRKRGFEQRERAQEDEEKNKEKNERDHDKRWREGERVDKRVGNWRDFSKGAGKKGKTS